jgi:hypothetical protein
VRFLALDNFIAPIPSYEGESPILAVPVSAWTSSGESASDSLKGQNAGSSGTRADKRKVAATLPPSKKKQRVVSKKALGVMINDLAPQTSPAPTPPRCTQGGFTMHQSNRYL